MTESASPANSHVINTVNATTLSGKLDRRYAISRQVEALSGARGGGSEAPPVEPEPVSGVGAEESAVRAVIRPACTARGADAMGWMGGLR